MYRAGHRKKKQSHRGKPALQIKVKASGGHAKKVLDALGGSLGTVARDVIRAGRNTRQI